MITVNRSTVVSAYGLEIPVFEDLSDYSHIAMDADGSIYAYKSEPIVVDKLWSGSAAVHLFDVQDNFQGDWKDSLIRDIIFLV